MGVVAVNFVPSFKAPNHVGFQDCGHLRMQTPTVEREDWEIKHSIEPHQSVGSFKSISHCKTPSQTFHQVLPSSSYYSMGHLINSPTLHLRTINK